MSLLLLSVLLGSVDPHQATQKAEVQMLQCFYGQAAVLDDNISEASTIARGVVNACHPQFDDWKYANFEELRPPSAPLFYERLAQAASSEAVEVVLRVRAASKH